MTSLLYTHGLCFSLSQPSPSPYQYHASLSFSHTFLIHIIIINYSFILFTYVFTLTHISSLRSTYSPPYSSVQVLSVCACIIFCNYFFLIQILRKFHNARRCLISFIIIMDQSIRSLLDAWIKELITQDFSFQ